MRGGTYFSLLLQREVGKRKQLKPLILSGHRGLLGVVVHLESVFVPLHRLVTRASYFRRRCARRRALLKTSHYVLCPCFPPGLGSSLLHLRLRLRLRDCDWNCDRNDDRDYSTPTNHLKWEAGECLGASPRRSRRPPQTSTEARGFPCRPVRDARSAEWELMTPLSLTRNVREHGFQMHHYP